MFNIESEKAVINIMVNDKQLTGKLISMVRQEWFGSLKENFYSYLNGQIFHIIKTIYNNGLIPDFVLIYSNIIASKLESAISKSYLSEILNAKIDSNSYSHHVITLSENFNKRKLIELLNQINLKIGDKKTSFNDLMGILTKYTYLAQDNVQEKIVDLEELVSSLNKESLKRIEENQVKFEYTTGFTQLDKSILLKDGSLVIIAARPGMGKTSFSLKIASHIAKEQGNTAFFSFEMSKEDLLTSLISMETMHPIGYIEKVGEAEKISLRDRVLSSANFQYKLYFDDKPHNIDSLIAELTYLVKVKKVENIFIDYLQLMVTDNKNTNGEVTAITRALKLFALKHKIRIFLLSQLNRSLEHRDNKRPTLSDLRDSGSIEQDADIVLFLYRPKLYGESVVKIHGEIVSSNLIAELIIGKNRRGMVGTIPLTFIGEFVLFTDYDQKTVKGDLYEN